MLIKIYGTGCASCEKLYQNVVQAKKMFSEDFVIEKETDIQHIADAGVISTPALSIDGKLVSSGKIVSTKEIVKLLEEKGLTIVPSTGCECSCGCSQNKVKTQSLFKKVIIVLLLGLVTWGLFSAVKNQASDKGKTEHQIPQDAVEIYYFHGTQRCMTCNKIQSFIKSVIKNSFSSAVDSGKMIYEELNYELPENRELAKKYNLSFGTIVIQKNGKFEKLDEIWTLIKGEQESFNQFLIQKITPYLKD